MSNVWSRYSSICFHLGDNMSTCSLVSGWGWNDKEQSRLSHKCLFSIDLRYPGRIVDGAPHGPSLVPARLAIARGATTVFQVGEVLRSKRFFLCRRHCSFWLGVSIREILGNDQGARYDKGNVERAGAGHGWKRLRPNWASKDSTELHLPPRETHVINRVLRQARPSPSKMKPR